MADSDAEHPEQRPLLLRIGHEELVIRKRYEVLSIGNDLLIAIWFVLGSVLFFSESTTVAGTWLFLLGSIQLMIRPLIRLHRRIRLRRLAPDSAAETARDFCVLGSTWNQAGPRGCRIAGCSSISVRGIQQVVEEVAP